MATPSLISDLLLHPLNFSTLTGPILTSIQHLTTALTLITAVQTNDTPTLGLLTELQPLVNGFKRFVKRSDQKETGRVGDKEEAKNEKDKAAAAAAAAANCADGDNEDVFNIEDGTEFLTAEDNVVLDKINAAFLKQSRNPRSVKPNFQKVFSEMDQSGDGKLDYDELRAALQSINIELTDEEMDTLMKRLDIDGDGDVNYMEFIRFVKVQGDADGTGVSATTKLEEALTHVSRAIFLNPDHHLFNLRAEIYFRLHDLKSCVSNLRYVLKLLPGDQVTRRRLARVIDLNGVNWLRAENHEAAATCFVESCKLDPVAGPYWVHQCVALVYCQEFEAALKCVEQAMSVEKGSADVYCLRGKIHWALDLTDAGNRDFRSAQELEPMHPEVVEYVTLMIEKSGGYYHEAMEKMVMIEALGGLSTQSVEEVQEAIRLLTQALGLVPDDMRILVLRAKARRKINMLEESLSDIDAAAFAYCQGMLGDAVPKFVPNRRMWLETQSMKASYREPFILTEQRSLTLNFMAMNEMKVENYAKAIGLLNRIIDDNWKMGGKDMTQVDAKYFVNRGDCYRATGKVDMAMNDFHRAYDSDPNNWETKTRLSLIHHMAGLQLFNERQYQQAEVEFTIAIKYNPKVSQYFGDRGKCCFYMQNYDGAFEDYKSALKLDPGNKDILMRMQQFDPTGSVVAEFSGRGGRKGGGRQSSMSVSGNSNGLGSGLGGPETTRMSMTAPGGGTGFLPQLTSVTSVNPRLKNAQIVKEFVVSKRDAVSDRLSVNQRREDHPVKKQAIWSCLVPKKVEYGSLDNRRKMLKQKSKQKLTERRASQSGQQMKPPKC